MTLVLIVGSIEMNIPSELGWRCYVIVYVYFQPLFDHVLYSIVQIVWG